MKQTRKPLRILLVEDLADDAELTLHELGGAGFDIASRRVETKIEMLAALADGVWDVVISDFNLPAFSADAALAILREKDADIPFIIVSGCIGEESAISMMKKGASDFVMKDKLARLAPVIERELQDATARRERRQARNALSSNRKLLAGITSSLGEGIYVLNTRGELTFMNPEAERLLGWTAAELLGRNVHNIIHTQRSQGTPLSESNCGVLRVLKDGNHCKSDEDVFVRKDGTLIPVSITVSAVMEEGKAVAAVAAFQDISLRKRAEHDLLESRAQLRELTDYLQTVREEERTRLARELHDELGQMLTAVKFDAKWLASNLSGAQQEITDKIASMSCLIDATLDAMRRVAADLRPVMLDDLGLVAAVEWLTEDFGKRYGLAIQFEREAGQLEYGCGGNCEKENCHMDAGVATGAFRIVQECLTNVAKHAQAERVRVFLKCRGGKLMIWVTDDGKGMHAADAEVHAGKPGSYGIIGMRERAIGLGGTIKITSARNKGASVEAMLPIKFVNNRGRDDKDIDRR